MTYYQSKLPDESVNEPRVELENVRFENRGKHCSLLTQIESNSPSLLLLLLQVLQQRTR